MKNTSRRQFIQTLAGSAIAAPYIVKCSRKARKPNLLFIWTDEQRADTMAIYGNSKVQAPNLNKLASESVVLQNAYVSQPVCTPSRSTVMTGLWPHTNGCTKNNIPLPADVPCLPEIISDPDYRTGYYGKWHLGDEIFAQHGFEEWVSIEDIYWRYFSEGRDRREKSSYWHYLKESGYQHDTDDGYFSRSFAAGLPIEHCKPKFLEQNACDFLQRYRNDPFMLYINFLEPHMPFTGPLNDLYDPALVDLPANFNDPLEEDEPLRYRRIRQRYRERGFGGHDLKTEAGWRRLIANYCGLVTQVDRSVGAILQKLEELGLADNTIVVYTSDHGDMMGAHRLLAKTVMYEESVRIPWLMRVPHLGRKQTVIKERTSHIDLVPTLLDMMDSAAGSNLPGRSLLPGIRGERTVDAPVFIEWNPSRKPDSTNADEQERAESAHIRTVVTQDGWKLCLSDNDKSQLFDLNRDPHETANLFYTGLHESKIRALARLIKTWQERVDDGVSLPV